MNNLQKMAWAGVLLGTSCSLWANAGKVLFASGDVTVERDQKRQAIGRGEALQQADTINTGVNGRAQLRMLDGALISLKPGTRFTIEAFSYNINGEERGGTAAPAVLEAGGTQRRPAAPSRSFYRLLKGGFRAISGLIGRDDRSAFRVQTPVATIGIRGTSFRVACVNDCTDGLAFGVSEGAIIASNDAGSLVLFDDEFGFVESSFASPVQVANEPAALNMGAPRPGARRGPPPGGARSGPGGRTPPPPGAMGTGGHRSPPQGRGPGGDRPPPPSTPDGPVIAQTAAPGGSGFRSVAFGFAGPLAHPGIRRQSADNVPENLSEFGPDNTLLAAGIPARSALVESEQRVGVRVGPSPDAPFEVVDAGFSRDFRIAWGRWAGGQIRAREGDRSFDSDTDAAGAHWVVSGIHDGRIAIPSTGSREFALLANTRPTNSSGDVGQLGSASLSANFSSSTVATTINLNIADTEWNAAGAGQIGSQAGPHYFNGNFDQVSVGAVAGGNGQFGGFFTPQAGGAGMTYALSGSNGEDAAGALVFQDAAPPPDAGGEPGPMPP